MDVADTIRMKLSSTGGWATDEPHPTQYRRTDAPPDVAMGSISVVEHPHGDTLDVTESLDEEEL
jgi:hypothetical protein